MASQDPSGQDRLRALLSELGGPPLGADIPTRDKPISLKLVNRAPPAEGPSLSRLGPILRKTALRRCGPYSGSLQIPRRVRRPSGRAQSG
jgi:hypothetical protein